MKKSGEYEPIIRAVKDIEFHNPDLEKSPDGDGIRIDKKGSRKNYFADNQIKYMPQD